MYYEKGEIPISRNVLGDRPRYQLQQYFFNKAKNYEVQIDDDQVLGSYVLVDDPIVNQLAIHIKPQVEEIFDREMFPTYTAMRLYLRGQGLPPHTDRLACEYSVSVTICQKQDTNELWSLYIGIPDANNPDAEAGYCLDPGDGVFYKGIDRKHHRNPCPYEWSLHAFFHYVEKRGNIYEYFRDIYPDIDEREMINLREADRSL